HVAAQDPRTKGSVMIDNAPGFATDVPLPVVGSLDARLIGFIDQHCAAEAGQIDAYRGLARSQNEAVRYLARLLAADEERHHEIMTEMRNHLLASALG